MKKLSFVIVAGMTFFAFQACNDGSDDAVESARESNEIRVDSAENSPSGANITEQDTDFVVKAASGGMMEVQLGELAKQKASHSEVKSFGEMMVTDHSKANEELKSIAMSKNITVPPAPGEDKMDHIKKLSDKSGKEFDRDYMDLMTKDHEEDVSLFEKYSENGNDPQLKAFAAKTLPTLRAHHEKAKSIHDNLK